MVTYHHLVLWQETTVDGACLAVRVSSFSRGAALRRLHERIVAHVDELWCEAHFDATLYIVTGLRQCFLTVYHFSDLNRCDGTLLAVTVAKTTTDLVHLSLG